MRLNQVLAIESDLKKRVFSEITELDKACRKAELLNGFVSTYEPLAEDGDLLPTEQKRVQFNSREVLDSLHRGMAELFDIVATKDWANCEAKSDIVVDGKVVLAQGESSTRTPRPADLPTPAPCPRPMSRGLAPTPGPC